MSQRVPRWVRTAQPYFGLLDRIHRYLLPRTYVEIGVSRGTSLALAMPGTICVGVDPQPLVGGSIRRRARIFGVTSDEFFENQDRDRVLAGRPLDLAFIDGMHHFEVALRDFMHLEQWGSEGTTILLHDCYPVSEEGASRDRTTLGWSGDVWKTVVCLKRWRPDLRVSVVDAGPTGLAVISGIDPSSTVLSDHYDEIVGEFMDLSYSYLEQHGKADSLNLVPDRWDVVRDLLPGEPFRPNATTLRLRRALRPDRWSFVGTRAAHRARTQVSRTLLQPLRRAGKRAAHR